MGRVARRMVSVAALSVCSSGIPRVGEREKLDPSLYPQRMPEYPDGLRVGDQFGSQAGEFMRYANVSETVPTEKEQYETLKMGADLRCDVCNTIVRSLVQKAESLSEDHIMDQFEGVPGQLSELTEDLQANRLKKARRGCNKHFKDEVLLKGYFVWKCSASKPANKPEESEQPAAPADAAGPKITILPDDKANTVADVPGGEDVMPEAHADVWREATIARPMNASVAKVAAGAAALNAKAAAEAKAKAAAAAAAALPPQPQAAAGAADAESAEEEEEILPWYGTREWCLAGPIPGHTTEEEANTYDKDYEGIYHACEHTVGRFGDDLGRFLAEKLEDGAKDVEYEDRERYLFETIHEGCREIANCERYRTRKSKRDSSSSSTRDSSRPDPASRPAAKKAEKKAAKRKKADDDEEKSYLQLLKEDKDVARKAKRRRRKQDKAPPPEFYRNGYFNIFDGAQDGARKDERRQRRKNTEL